MTKQPDKWSNAFLAWLAELGGESSLFKMKDRESTGASELCAGAMAGPAQRAHNGATLHSRNVFFSSRLATRLQAHRKQTKQNDGAANTIHTYTHTHPRTRTHTHTHTPSASKHKQSNNLPAVLTLLAEAEGPMDCLGDEGSYKA